jgi:hypothetical protein
MAGKAPLKVAAENSDPNTPHGKLGSTGLALWRKVTSAYEFADPASYELLYQSCAAADRAAELARLIDKDGALLFSANGVVKDHPALRHELANRVFLCRTLARLGLDLEPIGPIGRPSRK